MFAPKPSSCLLLLALLLTLACIPGRLCGTTLSSVDMTQGSSPESALVRGNDGNFYGTTQQGGSHGYGTVFKVTPGGVFTSLVSFSGTNGQNPYASLVIGLDGNFYGTTYNGGTSGDGTVFKITPAGTLTTLINLNGTNGYYPLGGLVQDSSGNFYGTTNGETTNAGTIFKLTPNGSSGYNLATLVVFNGTNGENPHASLFLGGDGNLYGTTQSGGTAGGQGTVFRMTPSGTLTTLTSFNGADGNDPIGGLVQGSNGILYGTTSQGGTSDDGTVFSLTPYGNGADYSYTLTTMFDFSHSDGNGTSPTDTLIQGLDGNLYGTSSGYVGGNGSTVFKITPGGTLTTLLSFAGVSMWGGLVQDSTGIFYGTTINGGTSSGSTVFRYNPSNVENVTFTTSTDIPLTSSSYTITGSSLNVILDYAPMPGTVLTVDRNTGTTNAISGTFTNLPNGGTISATYEGTNYTFTANYSGGAGKDLTLTLTSSTIISDTPLLPLWAWLVLVVALFVAGSRRMLPGRQ